MIKFPSFERHLIGNRALASSWTRIATASVPAPGELIESVKHHCLRLIGCRAVRGKVDMRSFNAGFGRGVEPLGRGGVRVCAMHAGVKAIRSTNLSSLLNNHEASVVCPHQLKLIRHVAL